MVALLKWWKYDCGEEEVLEYLKEYPITKEELGYEKESQAKIKKIVRRVIPREKR